jgi:hypothetical protein
MICQRLCLLLSVLSRCGFDGVSESESDNPRQAAFVPYFFTFPLGLGQRASTVVFKPPRGVNSPRIVHHSG